MLERDRCTITGTGNTTYDGRQAEIVHALKDGRFLVAIDNYSTANGLRLYDAKNLAPVPPAPAPHPADGRTLVFEDTFSGAAVDTTKWGMYDGPGHAGHGLRKPSAFTLENGILVITAKMVDGVIVSGGMSRKSTQMYGFYETRIRTEVDPANVMSGLALTYEPKSATSKAGENDFYETGRGAGGSTPDTFIHYLDAAGVNRHLHHAHAGIDATQWHVWGMNWRADRLEVWRDGVKAWTCPSYDLVPRTAQKFCLQLDAMVAGVALTQPVRQYVDYVRIWD